ncbi:MAG: cobaltochelatase subunit CobN, partial [Rhodospirillales bacterium]|nr:cobaltochelatase subunit CobN [Rhodospirillales bacterium]
MHLLAATPGLIADGSQAIDLGQSPGEIVFLSAADSELACLAGAVNGTPCTLRLANLMRLQHHLSVDLYVEKTVSHARLVVVRLLGGRSYWPYGLEQIVETCRRKGLALALLPGDDRPDADLMADSTLPREAVERLWRYLVHGGVENARQFLLYAGSLIGQADEWREPAPLPPAGAIRDTAAWHQGRPVAALVFYRALLQAGNTEPVDALAQAMNAQGLNVLPIHVHSLKDPLSAAILRDLLAATPPDVVVNATGFALATPGRPQDSPFGDCPVLQVILAGGGEPAWREGTNGLSARDIAMNVALPEVDGRIITRAIAFKQAASRDEATQCDLVRHVPVADRVAFVAELAANWVKLRRKPAEDRRIALILANYPNRDGRLGNGVGLDTPAATIEVLKALQAAGYGLRDLPTDGDSLVRLLQAGPTNDLEARRWRETRE